MPMRQIENSVFRPSVIEYITEGFVFKIKKVRIGQD